MEETARQVEPAPSAEASGASFRNILKSTSLIGGASVVNILIGMVRTKFVAVLLGPAGVGLLGLYTQVATLASTVSGMGIATSGVRQVAEAAGTDDRERIARTVLTLRRTAWVTGALGMLGLAAVALPLSVVTFGDRTHAVAIALLGVTILLGQIAAGQSCVLRGTRRIADVARVTVLGSLSSTLVSIPCYFLWGIRGIVAALVLSAASALAVSWWYARRVPVAAVSMSWRESGAESRSLLRLGLSFMGAGLVGTAATYVIQASLLRRFGASGLGVYQAAFSLSSVLVGFVLNAMGADYYPRLTAARTDETMRTMVDEQSQVSTLLALPGLAAMMVFSPLIITVFYAPQFEASVPLLRWFVLGLLGRVLSWPLGFVILAKGNGRLYLVSESLAAGVHVAGVVVLAPLLGVQGAAIAFLALYVLYACGMIGLTTRLVGFPWSQSAARVNITGAAVLAGLMINASWNPEPFSRWGIGIIICGAATWICLNQVMRRSGVSFSTLRRRLG